MIMIIILLLAIIIGGRNTKPSHLSGAARAVRFRGPGSSKLGELNDIYIYIYMYIHTYTYIDIHMSKSVCICWIVFCYIV